MLELVTFLKDAGNAGACAAQRLREINRGSGDGEFRRFDLKMIGDNRISDLVITPAADAVDKLICDDEPQEHRQRQRPRRKAMLRAQEKLFQSLSRFPAI